MSFVTLLKLLATMVVIIVLGFTAMLSWHVAVEPLGGVFQKFIPEPVGKGKKHDDREVAQSLEPVAVPDVDLGERPYQRATELLAMGKVDEARERLKALINSYPSSASAPMARRILGEMNLDDLLSTQVMEGKQPYRVVGGDAYLGIAARHQTTLENMLHLNSKLEMRGLRPGDELLLMPLNFRLLIESKRSALSVWDEGKFVCEYPLLRIPESLVQGARATEVDSKSAETTDGKRVLPGTAGYAAAGKVIQIKQPAMRIQSWNGEGEVPGMAILLHPADMEELNLLTRKGSVVEFR
jgi:hypothetical protein